MRRKAAAVACGIVLALLTYASAAWATFPGHDGIIALPVNHIPYVIGIARIGQSGPPINLESRKTSFYFGCQINVLLLSEPCFGGRRSPGFAGRPSFSASGRRLVLDNGSQLDFLNSNGSAFRKLPQLTHGDTNPTWFPDGKLVAFTGELTGHNSKTAIFTVNVNGTGLHRLAAGGDDAAVSPNGKLIAFDRRGRHGHRDLWLMDSAGSHQRMFATNGSNPCFSPDGLHLVLASVTPKGTHVIQRIDVTGANRETIAQNGDLPAWSPNGRLVAYSANVFGTQPDLADLFVIPAAGGTRKRLAYDNPISEDDSSFGIPDWQPRVR
jgi:Tol biopolymer transport system component